MVENTVSSLKWNNQMFQSYKHPDNLKALSGIVTLRYIIKEALPDDIQCFC